MVISLFEAIFCYYLIKKAECTLQKKFIAPIYKGKYLVEATQPVSFSKRFAFIIVDLINLSMALWGIAIYFKAFRYILSDKSSNHFIVTVICPLISGLEFFLIFRLSIFFLFFIMVPAKVDRRQRLRLQNVLEFIKTGKFAKLTYREYLA